MKIYFEIYFWRMVHNSSSGRADDFSKLHHYFIHLKPPNMRTRMFFLPALLTGLVFISCNNSSSSTSDEKKDTTTAVAQLKEDNTSYNAGSTNMNGYVVYKDSGQEKRPAVLVVPEWWGLNDYAKGRARQLADLGYVAMAVDMYGNGQTAANPGEAMKLAGPFYQNPQLTKTRLDAALQKLKTYPEVDTNNIAAIGYCHGGYVVLNAAKLGEPLKGVVSFHGDLSGVKADKNLMTAKVLVLHGEADPLVKLEVVQQFKHQMDSAGVPYTFKSYPNAKHAFTNPAADSVENKFHIGVGYNAEADKQSWNDMKEFLQNLFGK
jgi:dienelactone hydrolase